jgi:hypothetical protein
MCGFIAHSSSMPVLLRAAAGGGGAPAGGPAGAPSAVAGRWAAPAGLVSALVLGAGGHWKGGGLRAGGRTVLIPYNTTHPKPPP